MNSPMQEVEVVIDESGLTCTTVNQYEDPTECSGGFCRDCADSNGFCTNSVLIKFCNPEKQLEAWKQAESERKMYKIDNIQCTSNSENNKVLSVCLKPSRLFQENFRWVEIGSIHKAKIINGNATIL